METSAPLIADLANAVLPLAVLAAMAIAHTSYEYLRREHAKTVRRRELRELRRQRTARR